MNVENVDHVAVLGAGSMGHGITEVVAMAGFDVTMRDVEAELVEEGYESIRWSLEKLDERGQLEEAPETVLNRVSTAVDVEAATAMADLVVEAVPERMALKKEVFADLEASADEETVLATNTSSLSVTEIASATDHPERVCGLHFFNPPVKMELVEVIHGEATTEETAGFAAAFVEALGKTPIHVRKDVEGFVVNGVLGPFIGEPAWMVSAGEATVRGADAAMAHERDYPMGPFELADLTGIDVSVHVREEAGRPVPPVLAEKVQADELGRKTGRGFYGYSEGEGPDYEPADGEGFDWLRVEARIVNEAARIVGEGVADPEAVDTGMRLGTGFPEGPCRRGDRLGLERVLGELRELHEETGEDRYRPHPHLVGMVESGRTGEAAGAGFFEYDDAAASGDEHLTHRLDGDGLLAVVLDRPDRLNALSPALSAELVDLLSTVDTDAVRAVTIEGAGDQAFCAGADIDSFAELAPAEVDVGEVYEAVASFPRPTLAKVDGYCLGGGLELALACDLRVATERSRFGFPEVSLGLIPGGGGTQRTVRELGEARTKELVFRGNHIDADRAAEWGLLNRSVPAAALEETVDEFVSDLLDGPPVALRKAKQVIDEGRDADLETGLLLESQAFGLLLSTADAEEGTAAFSEDREPEFEGR
jgi:enoyl-CoA hydratase/3-hydroxyacyl-CoA dehydrogenase